MPACTVRRRCGSEVGPAVRIRFAPARSLRTIGPTLPLVRPHFTLEWEGGPHHPGWRADGQCGRGAALNRRAEPNELPLFAPRVWRLANPSQEAV
jgi:hypothetical protein